MADNSINIALAIIKKSMAQLFYNRRAALRISGLLWLIIFATRIWAERDLINAGTSLDSTNSGIDRPQGLGLGAFLHMGVYLIFGAWIAVRWHRFMLLAESQDSYLPKWDRYLIWHYIVASLKVFIISIVGLLPIIPLAYFFNQFEFIQLISLVLYQYILLRISLILPALAVQKPTTIGESWRATGPIKLSIFVAALCIGVLIGGIIYFGDNPTSISLPYLIVSFFTDWFILMVNVTIITTLYGYLVEGRDIA